MGRRHLAAWAHLERATAVPARLVGVCDQDPRRAAAAAEQFAAATQRRPRVFASLDAALDDPDVGAVDLVIPTRYHHQSALTALAAGRHVLVEKPFAITIRACRVMAAAAAGSGRVLAVAENYRRVPTHRALKSLLDQGVIGRPYVASVHTVQQALPPAPGEWFRERGLVGSLPNLEFAVH